MKVLRERILDQMSERLLTQLENEKERNVKLAGFCLLPEVSEETVKNVPDSSKYKDPCNNSCIGYWEEKAKYEIKDDAVYHCPACGSEMSKKISNLDGAHVYIIGNPDKWFFVPLCSKCNNPNNRKTMKVNTVLVPVPDECYEEK